MHLIATVSPGAMKGSTAPYAYAEVMLIEAGNRQPRTLANAFRNPCAATSGAATGALQDYLGKIDAAYGAGETRRHLSVEPAPLAASETLALPQLAAWAAQQAGA